MKMEKAKSLLTAREMNITEIVYSIGLMMCIIFQRLSKDTQDSPTEFRDMLTV